MQAACLLIQRHLSRLLLLLFGTLLLSAAPLSGQVIFDASSNQSAATGSTTVTFQHVLGSGGNRLVVCTVALSNPTTGFTQITPTVSFGGVAMTPVAQAPGSAQSSPKIETEMFWANDTTLSALTGTQTVSVSLSATPNAGVVAGCSSYIGVVKAGVKPGQWGGVKVGQ
jgi:hypothetical protein